MVSSAINTPLVSIVIPTYNQANYLQAGIDHCIYQTYQNIELIIVDGGSNDQTKELLNSLSERIESTTHDPVTEMDQHGIVIRSETRTYPQNRSIKILSFDEDIGATKTYNEGLNIVNGKYCTYVVGDDLPHPHMIEEMVEVLEGRSCDFVYSDMNLLDDNGHIIRQMRMPDYSFSHCFAKWYHLGVSKLYRTDMHEIAGLMNEEYMSANDYDHYLRFAMAGCRFFHLPRILYSIRWHGPERRTGQHTSRNYKNLISESKRCAFRARAYMDSKII